MYDFMNDCGRMGERVTHCSASSSGHLPAKICKGRCEIGSSGNHPGVHHSRWQLVLVHLYNMHNTSSHTHSRGEMNSRGSSDM